MFTVKSVAVPSANRESMKSRLQGSLGNKDILFELGFIRAARGHDQRAPPVQVVHVRYDVLLVRSR